MILGVMTVAMTFASRARAQTCSDLFRAETPASYSRGSGVWGGFRDASQAIYDHFLRTKIETAFESSFNESERRVLRELVEVQGNPRIVVRRFEAEMRSWDSQNDVFLYLFFEKMSPEARAVLNQVLDSRRALRNGDRIGDSYEMIRVVSGTPVRYASFLSVVIENWAQDTRLDHRSFPQWMNELQAAYRQRQWRGEFASRDFQERFWSAYQRTISFEVWRQTFALSSFGIFPNAKGELYIGSRLLGRLESEKGDVVFLRVPRANIKRAAWNPISNSVILKKIQNGFRRVQSYDGFLAADGYFYLSDGNHRFALDHRQEVVIKVSNPVSVSSLSDSLDALGISQPKPDQLVLYQQGRLALEDMVGEAGAKRLILVQPPYRN